MSTRAALANPVRVGLIGTGRIGSSHAEIIARRVPGAELVSVTDAVPSLHSHWRVGSASRPIAQSLLDPDIEAVVVAARPRPRPARRGRRGCGKAVFCEKPMALTLADADRALQLPKRRACRSRSASTVASRRTSSRPMKPSSTGDRNAAADAVGNPGPGLANPGGGTALDDLHPDPDPRLRHAALAESRRGAGRGLRRRRRPGRAGVQGRRTARHRSRRDQIRQRRHRHGRGELLRRVRLRRPRRGVRFARHGHRRETAETLDGRTHCGGPARRNRARRRRAVRRRLHRGVRRVHRCSARAA